MASLTWWRGIDRTRVPSWIHLWYVWGLTYSSICSRRLQVENNLGKYSPRPAKSIGLRQLCHISEIISVFKLGSSERNKSSWIILRKDIWAPEMNLNAPLCRVTQPILGPQGFAGESREGRATAYHRILPKKGILLPWGIAIKSRN